MPRRLQRSPGALPLALRLLRPRRRPKPSADPTATEPPPLALTVDRAPIDGDALGAWRRACGYDAGDAAPLPYLFVLAFSAQAELLLDPASPFAPTGMVHIASRLEADRELRAGESLRLELRLDAWRRVRKGREIDVDIRYFDDRGEVARGLQTSFARGGGTGEAAPATQRKGPPDFDFETWRLEADAGRAYARVSGDWNPIHLWPITAMPFGYRRPIAHGMHLVARACAALEPSGAAARRRLDVRFKTPADLPAVVRLYRTGGGFELWRGDGSRPHAAGQLQDLGP